jgi:Ca2+-binding RTX toxin-like protein
VTLANGWDRNATVGNVVNLATGQILNDGFGNAEVLNVTDGAGRLELDTSNLNDNITGSVRDERFILRGGNDTLDGGGGFDLLRFDRGNSNSTSAVTVDLALTVEETELFPVMRTLRDTPLETADMAFLNGERA